MGRRPTVYGLDIETDTSENGLDPRVARVLTVALSCPGHDEVFSGRESTLLFDVDQRLAELEPGVIATWNGAAFDLPFISDRAALYGLELGLRLQLDPQMSMCRAPLPGHRGAYRGAWYGHGHVDAYRLYRGDVGPAPHDLRREALHACASSDARLARVLTERRWSSASRVLDRLPRPAGEGLGHAIA